MQLSKAQILYQAFALWVGLCLVTACQAADVSSKQPIDPEKTQLDLGTIFLHVQEVMNLKEEADQVFVRWERPVRYYLQGLEKYPELEKLFEEQIREIAQITGLDIKRHEGLYLEYKDPAKRQVGPDGLSTNAAIFFAEDMEQAFQDEKVIKILKGFGDDPKESYEFWEKNSEAKKELGLSKFGLDWDGLKFYFYLAPVSSKPTYKNYYDELILLVLRMISKIERNANKITSIYNSETPNDGPLALTNFDKVFLSTYYSKEVKSGITKREAALAITEVLAKQYGAGE